jgi:hypothetical protein
MTNVASKEILARLLANENIIVNHDRVPTPSFNVRDRILTLPQWDDMATDTYDHFVGHEVGHALYTPEEGWHESVSERGQTYRSFLNVVEDARIEKMIQARYPGLRRSFISSYKRLLAEGFFGADLETINTYGLIDRINTYFKCGPLAGVRIDKSEMAWVKEIEKLETWEQVVDVTDRLYDFIMGEQAKLDEEIEQSMSQEPDDEYGDDEMEDFGDLESDDGEDDGDSDGFGNYESDEDGEEDEGGSSGPNNGEESDEGDDDSASETGSNGAGKGDQDDRMSSKTDSNLRKSIEQEFGDKSDIAYSNITLNDAPVDSLIVDYKTLLNEILSTTPDASRPYNDQWECNKKALKSGKVYYDRFLKNNKSSINYMVKEFEMKKSASAYSRQTVSKTGVIDPLKMNSYKFNDDIFRKVTTTQDGKSHGMIMYVDWSGSMVDDLVNTVDQLLNLVHFCRQVSIPFRVFAFTDRFDDADYGRAKVDVGTSKYGWGFRLVEYFNSDMKKVDFIKACHAILAIAKYASSWGRNSYYELPNVLDLGGTPLDDAIVAAIKVHEMFQKKHRVDIVNTIFLTDGDSHPMEAQTDCGVERLSSMFDHRGNWRILYLNDPVTKKRYRVMGPRGQQTAALLKMYRDRTGSTTIGYRIVPSSLRGFVHSMPSQVDYTDRHLLHKEMKKANFVVLPTSLGYDRAYAIAGGKNLKTSNGAILVEDDASKSKIRTAFKKANNSRKGSRKLLSDLISIVA